MRSGPTTCVDLGAAAFLADPYPQLADERRRHGIAWHEADGRWLTFDHAGAAAVLRSRALGRVWREREPASDLEAFNALHRHQLMELEGAAHTRLRRLVSAAFARGHVERLRPRVRELAASLLADCAGAAATTAGFDVVAAYAEPLPVLVIAELLGVPSEHVPSLRAWSQAIVLMYEPSPAPAVVDAAVAASVDFAALVREVAAARRQTPREDLVSDLVASGLGEEELVATVVLLLNAGHEASVNALGNGLVSMLGAGLRPAADVADVAVTVEEMLRHDSALQLFERTALDDVEIGGVRIRRGERVAALLGAAHRDPAVFERPDVFDPARPVNPHLAFGAGVHFCLGAPLARMELVESVGALFAAHPTLRLSAPPQSRGTFVLRGCERVWVTGVDGDPGATGGASG